MDNPSMDGLDMDLAHAAEEIQRWQRAAEANIGENVRLRHEKDEGWKEAAIAWEVCASIHEKWAKGKDALYSTRHADFVKHAADARAKLTPNDTGNGPRHGSFEPQPGIKPEHSCGHLTHNAAITGRLEAQPEGGPG